jgi:hypothetical protein
MVQKAEQERGRQVETDDAAGSDAVSRAKFQKLNVAPSIGPSMVTS